MPQLQFRILIIACWSIFTGILFYKDLLPEILVGEPPSWKSITSVNNQRPSKWLILVENGPDQTRVIGQATTTTTKRNDKSTELKSRIKIDAKGLFQGTPLAVAESTEFQFMSTILISPQGLLEKMQAEILLFELGEKPILTIQAVPSSNNTVDIKFQSNLTPILNFRQTMKMSPSNLVRGGLEPLDYLPNLRVGQRWNTRILQPITARPEEIKNEVTELNRIFWGGNPLEVFVIEHKSATFTAKTYVRKDGLVIRQQLPTPFVRLILEREPEMVNP